MSNDERPVTRGSFRTELGAELDEHFAANRRQRTADIASAVDFMVRTLKQHIDDMGDRLSLEIARTSLANTEQLRDEMRALDDRDATLHRGLPKRRTPR